MFQHARQDGRAAQAELKDPRYRVAWHEIGHVLLRTCILLPDMRRERVGVWCEVGVGGGPAAVQQGECRWSVVRVVDSAPCAHDAQVEELQSVGSLIASLSGRRWRIV